MYEIAGSQFEKGVLELRLEKAGSKLRRFALALGPLRGRLFALSFILLAAFLSFKQQPASLLLRQGLISDPGTAYFLQKLSVWGLVGIGLLIQFSVLLLRSAGLSLTFDRGRSQLEYHQASTGFLKVEDAGIIPFKNISLVKVYSAEREPKSPYGFIEIEGTDAASQQLKKFRFRLLSEEQFKFYPANLSKILDRPISGDWKDPDEEVLQSP